MKRKVLLTGATGFLGRHLTAAFEAEHVPAVALVRATSPWPPSDWAERAGKTTAIFGSALDPTGWRDAAAHAGIGTIIHAAAVVHHSRESVEETMRVNVEGTLQVVRAARDIGARVVLVSAGGTVGCFKRRDLVADEHAPHLDAVVGDWPYYASKLRAEREGQRLAEKLGVDFTVARLPVLLGPQDHRRRSTGHVSRILDGRMPFVPSGGIHFTDVRDVATALARLTRKHTFRSAYHFPGTHVTFATFCQMVGDVTGQRVDARFAPRPLLRGVATAAERMTRYTRLPLPRWMPDPVALEMSSHFWGLGTLWTHKDLHYQARLPRQTLVDTVDWLRAQEAGSAPRAA